MGRRSSTRALPSFYFKACRAKTPNLMLGLKSLVVWVAWGFNVCGALDKSRPVFRIWAFVRPFGCTRFGRDWMVSEGFVHTARATEGYAVQAPGLRVGGPVHQELPKTVHQTKTMRMRRMRRMTMTMTLATTMTIMAVCFNG